MARLKTEPPKQKAISNRELLLTQAISIVTQDRNSSYGNPEDNFRDIADFWNSYLTQRTKRRIMLNPQDVAHMMILMKVGRLTHNPSHADSLLDIAGYAACGYDCQQAAEVGQAADSPN